MRGVREPKGIFGMGAALLVAGFVIAVFVWVQPQLINEAESLLRQFVNWVSRGIEGSNFWIAEPPRRG